MNNIKVSIIVPVYNVADYLRRCLDSCVNQTLQQIEVILVNDCSPDPLDSEIMKEYEGKFPNKVRCIWHKENLRLGGARNTGIRAACGEFIYCVDSDDYIDLKLCEKMYNAAVAENADMIVCNTTHIDKSAIIKNWNSNGSFNTSDLCERIKNLKRNYAYNIMIKKTVIEDNNLYFSNHNGFEDAMCLLWYLASKKIARVNESLYYYCIRNNSITQEQKIEDAFFVIQAIKYILSLDYFNNLDPIVKKTLFLYLIKVLRPWCQTVCVKYSAEFVKFCDDIIDLFKIYRVDYEDYIYMQSGEDIISKEIFNFIEQNINIVDFPLEFAAYYEYRYKIMRLKKMHSLFSLYANKRLTLWGAGQLGKINAENMSMLGFKFEITDASVKICGDKVCANIAVKPWDEVKYSTDVVFVSVGGLFRDLSERMAKECPNIEVVDLVGLLES